MRQYESKRVITQGYLVSCSRELEDENANYDPIIDKCWTFFMFVISTYSFFFIILIFSNVSPDFHMVIKVDLTRIFHFILLSPCLSTFPSTVPVFVALSSYSFVFIPARLHFPEGGSYGF